jgi:hypothetical protein
LIEGCDRSSEENELEARAKQVLLEAVKKGMKRPTTRIQEEEVALEEAKVLAEEIM